MNIFQNKVAQLSILLILGLVTGGLAVLVYGNFPFFSSLVNQQNKPLEQAQAELLPPEEFPSYTFRAKPGKYGADFDKELSVVLLTGVVETKEINPETQTIKFTLKLNQTDRATVEYKPEASITFIRTSEVMAEQFWGRYSLEEVDNAIQVGTVVTATYSSPDQSYDPALLAGPPSQVIIHQYLISSR